MRARRRNRWRRNRLLPKVHAICYPKILSSLFKYSIRAPHPTLDSVTMSRQAQKGAAAAAMRNQLKVDAARVKAAAARKDAAQLPEQLRPGGGGPVGGYGAANPPSSLTEASCLFNSQPWVLFQSLDPVTWYCLLLHSSDVCVLVHSFLPFTTWYCLLLHS